MQLFTFGQSKLRRNKLSILSVWRKQVNGPRPYLSQSQESNRESKFFFLFQHTLLMWCAASKFQTDFILSNTYYFWTPVMKYMKNLKEGEFWTGFHQYLTMYRELFSKGKKVRKHVVIKILKIKLLEKLEKSTVCKIISVLPLLWELH